MKTSLRGKKSRKEGSETVPLLFSSLLPALEFPSFARWIVSRTFCLEKKRAEQNGREKMIERAEATIDGKQFSAEKQFEVVQGFGGWLGGFLVSASHLPTALQVINISIASFQLLNFSSSNWTSTSSITFLLSLNLRFLFLLLSALEVCIRWMRFIHESSGFGPILIQNRLSWMDHEKKKQREEARRRSRNVNL